MKKKLLFRKPSIPEIWMVVISTITTFGFVVPYLISQPSTELALFGALLLGLYFTGIFVWVTKWLRK